MNETVGKEKKKSLAAWIMAYAGSRRKLYTASVILAI